MYGKYFEFHTPTKIACGENALANLHFELEKMNALNPIIITDKGVVAAGLLKKVEASLFNTKIKIAYVYDNTPSDSDIEVVNQIGKLFRSNRADSIIAIGGGSPIDTAKGVNILISENVSDIEPLSGVEMLTKPQLPLIIIPTTAGTGSEATQVAVISNNKTNCKYLFNSTLVTPRLAVLDPEMTMTLPPKLTAATGMDALTHAVEAYTCLQKNPISDVYAIASIKLIFANILTAINEPKNKTARTNMALASLLGGIAFSNSMVGAVHSIGHSIGSIAHVHHGVAMSILLPHVMKFNLKKADCFYSELLQYVREPEVVSKIGLKDRASEFIFAIESLQKEMNAINTLPIKFSEINLDKSLFEKIANLSMNDGSLTTNPINLNVQDVINILNASY